MRFVRFGQEIAVTEFAGDEEQKPREEEGFSGKSCALILRPCCAIRNAVSRRTERIARRHITLVGRCRFGQGFNYYSSAIFILINYLIIINPK